jgi:hypothetical protein
MIRQVKEGNFPRHLKECLNEVKGGYCWNEGCNNQATEFHHILPNTKVNQDKFPLYICSPFNCYPICHSCHMNKPLPDIPPERLILLFEEHLKNLQVLL